MKMEKCLNLRGKFSDKGFQDVKSRVINLCDAVGRMLKLRGYGKTGSSHG
jgi:hypothetical protein